MQSGTRSLATLTLAALTACGGDADTVARVGERRITGEDLRRFVMTLPPGLRSAGGGPEARRDYLQTLVDRELMLAEARARGLDRDPDLLAQLQRKVEDRVVSTYQRHQLAPQASVTPQEVDDTIADLGLDRERLTQVIVVDAETTAAALLAALAAGGDFSEIARQRSLDLDSATRGGYVGYLNRLTAPRAGIPQAVFDSLAVGALSPPLPLASRWQVVRFVADRDEVDPAVRTGVQTRLAREGYQEVEDARVEQLAGEFGWAVAPAGLEVLAGLSTQTPPPATTGDTPLFTYEGGHVTIADYLWSLRAHRTRNVRALTDRDFIAALGERFLRPRAMLLAAAARHGIPEEPEIVEWRARILTEMTLRALRDAVVVAAADSQVTEAAVQAYYDEHRALFREPAQYCFDEALLHSREEAEQVLAEIPVDADLLDLSRRRGYHVRKRNAEGLICVRSPAARVLPELWAALEAAPPGQVRGPVPLGQEQVWSLFKVVQREPERPLTFAEARERAAASVRARAQRERFDAWVAALRERRAGDVEVDAARLEAALPEALLAGTAPPTGT